MTLVAAQPLSDAGDTSRHHTGCRLRGLHHICSCPVPAPCSGAPRPSGPSHTKWFHIHLWVYLSGDRWAGTRCRQMDLAFVWGPRELGGCMMNWVSALQERQRDPEPRGRGQKNRHA